MKIFLRDASILIQAESDEERSELAKIREMVGDGPRFGAVEIFIAPSTQEHGPVNWNYDGEKISIISGQKFGAV